MISHGGGEACPGRERTDGGQAAPAACANDDAPQNPAGSPEFLGIPQVEAKDMNWRQRGRRSKKQAQAPRKQTVKLYQIVLSALLEAKKLRLATA